MQIAHNIFLYFQNTRVINRIFKSLIRLNIIIHKIYILYI